MRSIGWLSGEYPLLRLNYHGVVVSCIGTTHDTRGIAEASIPVWLALSGRPQGDPARGIALASWLIREKLLPEGSRGTDAGVTIPNARIGAAGRRCRSARNSLAGLPRRLARSGRGNARVYF